MAKDFMDVKNIKDNLKLNDAYTIKDWYEEYECGGTEFERMADALYDINEDEFLWQVADYISEHFAEEELLEVIRDEGWEWDLTPLERFKIDCIDEEPDFVNCTIKHKDGDTEDVIISLVSMDDLEDEDSNYCYEDEDIFFYAEDIDQVAKLFEENNGEDFMIVEYDSVEY